MRVSVQSNLVACIAHGCHFLWKRLQRVAWNEPGCFDIVLIEEFQQSLGSHRSRPNTCVLFIASVLTMENVTLSLQAQCSQKKKSKPTPADVAGRVFATV